jgi:hypothetical protein
MLNNFLSGDDDNPKKDADVVPLSATLTTPRGQPKETVVVKPSPVLPKKNSAAPPLKRLKKAAATAASLEVHQASSSSDYVSIASYN